MQVTRRQSSRLLGAFAAIDFDPTDPMLGRTSDDIKFCAVLDSCLIVFQPICQDYYDHLSPWAAAVADVVVFVFVVVVAAAFTSSEENPECWGQKEGWRLTCYTKVWKFPQIQKLSTQIAPARNSGRKEFFFLDSVWCNWSINIVNKWIWIWLWVSSSSSHHLHQMHHDDNYDNDDQEQFSTTDLQSGSTPPSSWAFHGARQVMTMLMLMLITMMMMMVTHLIPASPICHYDTGWEYDKVIFPQCIAQCAMQCNAHGCWWTPGGQGMYCWL